MKDVTLSYFFEQMRRFYGSFKS